ncbi:MAG: Glycosyl transferase family 2 [Candidatus Curtissbacteria bacterium GW2011_GWA2_41_24]|nr:MAG: Glycosyl transferase family 2 [Candidatus Curtissbacteria bacterium GW2011_GWA2_41_24]
MTELSIILPVQNEAEIIEQVFSEIFHSIKKITKKPEFILVENGSSDNSLKVIKKISQNYSNTLWAEAPKGYGWAVLKGLTLAEGKFVCYMDSDGQTNLSTIPKLLEEIKSGKWDLVTVTRQN